ncbi:MAG: hypothetical protein ACKVQV_10305, partial [Bacteroidia bacterium]
ILAYLIGAAAINHERSQLLSLLYSAFFIISFIIYVPFMSQSLDLKDYRRLLKTVFLIYLIGLLIGQYYVYTNNFAPLPNQSGYLIHGSWGALTEFGSFRYYSFSSEPSYAAFVVIVLYYSYITLDGRKGSLFQGENLYLFIILVYMIWSFKSSYGILLLSLIIVSYFGLTKTSVLMYLFSISAVVIYLMIGNESGPVKRVIDIIQKIDFGNIHNLSNIDFSVYFRIAPLLHYIRIFDFADAGFYIGHGAAASRKFIVPETYLAYEGDYLGGFIPAFFYDYGIIGTSLILAFIKKLLPGIFSIPTAIIALVLFNANINTQLFWLILTCLALNKYFQLELKHENRALERA